VVNRAAAAVAAALVAGASPALAHALLEHASPPVGGRVATAPAALDLSFTEGVVPRFSSVSVLGASGQAVRTGPPRVGKDRRDLVVKLPPLAPGQYTVVWRVTSEDTHRTEGRFSFTVGR
jgi:copper resistance protein C